MIIYTKGVFGINLMARVHGSAVYRALFPGLVSVAIYLLIHLQWRKNDDLEDLNHPYAVGGFVSAVSLLIVFRANYSYQRYWGSCASVFQMMSKWMDATTHTACYHLQCDHYDSMKPPSYYDYPQLKADFLTRDRERERAVQSIVNSGSGESEDEMQPRSIAKSIDRVSSEKQKWSPGRRSPRSLPGRSQRSLPGRNERSLREGSFTENEARPLMGKPRLDGGWETFLTGGRTTYSNPTDENDGSTVDPKGFASTRGGGTPPLFLQELAHLTSLLNAVAFSTLRNDVEGAESPLDCYHPGAPWPPVDSSKIPKDARNKIGRHTNNIGRYWLGMDRTPAARTRFNAARPLPVLGGVSDSEIHFLQMARGPAAKTQLAWQWVSELITREHLAGTLGLVGSPIISRVMQFLGDGMAAYNQARKVMFIPFPFPHAQLSVYAVMLVTAAVPFMLDQYTNEAWLGALLSFCTVTCLAGLHEVARELENPFRNVPNEIPLINLQAQFNETLLTMYSGYHPDAFWDPDKTLSKRRISSSLQQIPSVSQLHQSGETSQGEEEQFSNNGVAQLDQLQKLIDQQEKQLAASQQEIERLRVLVEGKTNSVNSNSVFRPKVN